MLTKSEEPFFSICRLLINSCSPALCGLKPASLFSLSPQDYEVFSNCLQVITQQLSYFGKSIRPVFRLGRGVVIFLYDPQLLSGWLASPAVQEYLVGRGYPSDLEAAVEEFVLRLANSPDFPHEAGIFLGYPLEDVLSFEENPHFGWKYCGLWKAYHDVDYAKEMSRRCRDCCSLCREWHSQGHTIPGVMKKYSRLKQVS